MSGPPWWLAYAWVVSLWVAAGCVGMAVFSACIDLVGRNGPEKRPECPSRGLGALRRPRSRPGLLIAPQARRSAPRPQPEPQTRTNHTDMETR